MQLGQPGLHLWHLNINIFRVYSKVSCRKKWIFKELSLSKSPIYSYMGRLFRVFKGVCWLGAQKRSEKNFKFFPPSDYMIIPLIPNHLIFTTWDTSIVVAPSKRNILTQTRVGIGSTHRDDSYETIMLTLSILFFPPVRSELVNAHSRGDSPRK